MCIGVLFQGLWYDMRGPARAGAEGAGMVVIGQLLLATALLGVPSYDGALCWLAFPAFLLVDFGAMLSMWSAAGLFQSWPNHHGVVLGSTISAWQISRRSSYVLASARSLLASFGLISATSLGLVILAFSLIPAWAVIAIRKLVPAKMKSCLEGCSRHDLENARSAFQTQVATQQVAPSAIGVTTNSTEFKHLHDIDELAQKTTSFGTHTPYIEGVERETTTETHHALPCHATASTNVHRSSTTLFQRSASLTEGKKTIKKCETPISPTLSEAERNKLPPEVSATINRSDANVTKRNSSEDLFKRETNSTAHGRGQHPDYDGFMWPARSPGVQLGHGRKQPLWRPCASGDAIDGHYDGLDAVIAEDENIKLPSATSDTHFAAPSLRDVHGLGELDGFDSSGQPIVKDKHMLDIGTKVSLGSLSQVEPLVLPPSSSFGADIPFPSPIIWSPSCGNDGENASLSARSVDADLGDVSEYFHTKGSPRARLHLGSVESPSRERLGGGSKKTPLDVHGVASETRKPAWPGSAWPPSSAQEKVRSRLHTTPKKFVGTSI